MAGSLAYRFSRIGPWFIIVAPILGWIGVALSGSNTSTNAMFGAFQVTVGKLLGFPPVLGMHPGRQPIDFVPLKQALKDRNQLGEIGGSEFLSDLYSFVPSAANASHYIGIVHQKWPRRKVILDCRRRKRRL
jgi:hypothetical protein